MTAYSAEMLPENLQIQISDADEVETAVPKIKIVGQIFPREIA